MTEMRHPQPDLPSEPGAHFPAWLLDALLPAPRSRITRAAQAASAEAVSLYCWLGIYGTNVAPERRTPEVLAPLMGEPVLKVAGALKLLREVGGLDANNRIQLFPPARGE